MREVFAEAQQGNVDGWTICLAMAEGAAVNLFIYMTMLELAGDRAEEAGMITDFRDAIFKARDKMNCLRNGDKRWGKEVVAAEIEVIASRLGIYKKLLHSYRPKEAQCLSVPYDDLVYLSAAVKKTPDATV